MQKSILSLVILFFLLSCNKDDGPTEPGMATLIFPENNSECTAGVSVSDTFSKIPFEWEASERTDTYILQVQNLRDGTTQDLNTATTSLEVELQKGEPYSWTVTSIRQDIPDTTQSETWKFYNAGDGTESYAPFPATLISPEQGTTVAMGTGDITLVWEGSDIDGDIAGYDVYFGNDNPPETAVASDVTDNGIIININSKAVYYWRIITKDEQGNRSESEVFAFKVN